jgi:hypothetical protein
MLRLWTGTPTKTCRACGAVYEIVINRSTEVAHAVYDCAVCGSRFDEWYGRISPSYKLVWRPSHTPGRKDIVLPGQPVRRAA